MLLMNVLTITLIFNSKVLGCPEDEFECLDFSSCIPNDFKCDQYDDCSDGSDEADCTDNYDYSMSMVSSPTNSPSSTAFSDPSSTTLLYSTTTSGTTTTLVISAISAISSTTTASTTTTTSAAISTISATTSTTTTIDLCYSDPCNGQGTCSQSSSQFTCTCNDGYDGVSCDTAVVPEKPGNFRASEVTSDSVSLAWDPPTGSNDIISYELYYDDNTVSSARSSNQISLGIAFEYTLRGLSAGTYYKIWVTSKSINGEESTVTSISVSTNSLEQQIVEDIASIIENNTAPATVAAVGASILGLAALTPPPLPTFVPQGLPQPGLGAQPGLGGQSGLGSQPGQPGASGGGGGSGGGTVPSVALQVPIVALDVALLTSGIQGAVVLSVFSSDLPNMSGFLIPRTVDATAVTFSEPDESVTRTSISRKEGSGNQNHSPTCKRPVIHIGDKINRITNKTNIVIDYLKTKPILGRISEVVEDVQKKIERLQMQLFDVLRINCLIPKVIRPFTPILEYFRCKFGLDDDQFMEAPACNEVMCEESLEEKFITNDRGPAPMTTMDLGAQTMSDCFEDMKEISYGARILAKVVRDKSCDDPKYKDICQELMDDDRIIMEETCKTPECIDSDDDPFRPCFACEGFEARKVYGRDYSIQVGNKFMSRQSGEVFQTTKQSKRIICKNGRANCRLRVDRAAQLRQRSYNQSLQFVQSEQYLTPEDTDIIRFIKRFDTSLP